MNNWHRFVILYVNCSGLHVAGSAMRVDEDGYVKSMDVSGSLADRVVDSPGAPAVTSVQKVPVCCTESHTGVFDDASQGSQRRDGDGVGGLAVSVLP